MIGGVLQGVGFRGGGVDADGNGAVLGGVALQGFHFVHQGLRFGLVPGDLIDDGGKTQVGAFEALGENGGLAGLQGGLVHQVHGGDGGKHHNDGGEDGDGAGNDGADAASALAGAYAQKNADDAENGGRRAGDDAEQKGEQNRNADTQDSQDNAENGMADLVGVLVGTHIFDPPDNFLKFSGKRVSVSMV